MDLEFTLDTDHRKRRRNRTTQSCLNCHTSKRKCDRKRPCQRCIQLGLTGLCVYEIDDPALRDDPSLDENTRLRNRIAELESLVRELRGKPHPRWADHNFRDGDPNEKWHSRATKGVPATKRRAPSPGRGGDEAPSRTGRVVPSSLLSPIKTEPANEPSPNLYRFSPSPAPSIRYHTFQSDLRSPSTSSFDNERHPPYTNGTSNVNFHSPSSPAGPYHGTSNGNSIPSSYSDGGGGSYHSDDSNAFHNNLEYNGSSRPSPHAFCACRTSPGLGLAYISLAHQLQSALGTLRQYSNHTTNTQCLLYRRIMELNSLMQGSEPADARFPYLAPLSPSTSFHTEGVSPQEWNPLAAAGYFPIQSDQNMYNSVTIT